MIGRMDFLSHGFRLPKDVLPMEKRSIDFQDRKIIFELYNLYPVPITADLIKFGVHSLLILNSQGAFNYDLNRSSLNVLFKNSKTQTAIDGRFIINKSSAMAYVVLVSKNEQNRVGDQNNMSGSTDTQLQTILYKLGSANQPISQAIVAGKPHRPYLSEYLAFSNDSSNSLMLLTAEGKTFEVQVLEGYFVEATFRYGIVLSDDETNNYLWDTFTNQKNRWYYPSVSDNSLLNGVHIAESHILIASPSSNNPSTVNVGLIEVNKKNGTSHDSTHVEVVSQITLNLNIQVSGAHLIPCNNLRLILVSPDGLVVVIPVTIEKKKDQQARN
ncbi:MAG: hypothetical protein NZT61_04545 [Deltaproteobacteria bacterium]|nr:hypothetical protein [Deltaproteobacteria bacterium]